MLYNDRGVWSYCWMGYTRHTREKRKITWLRSAILVSLPRPPSIALPLSHSELLLQNLLTLRQVFPRIYVINSLMHVRLRCTCAWSLSAEMGWFGWKLWGYHCESDRRVDVGISALLGFSWGWQSIDEIIVGAKLYSRQCFSELVELVQLIMLGRNISPDLEVWLWESRDYTTIPHLTWLSAISDTQTFWAYSDQTCGFEVWSHVNLGVVWVIWRDVTCYSDKHESNTLITGKL